ASYGGVLTRDGSAWGGKAGEAAPLPSTPGAAELQMLDGGRAVVRLGPACALPARAKAPPYVDVPGWGFVRQPEGALTLDGATCVVDGSRPITVATGSALVTGGGALELVATGNDEAGVAGSFRFIGTLLDEREVLRPLPGAVNVHLLSTMVRVRRRGAR